MKCADGNIFSLLDGRSSDSVRISYQYYPHHASRAIQMHSSLVQRLALEKVMEGHQGCVNSLCWNSTGSLLLSGSDDFQVNLWGYGTNKLLHSIHSGHSNNIFCTKFMPETGDDMLVSGAGDAEVRVHRVSRSGGARRRISSSEQTALFCCHSKRVKKLAVEDGNPHLIWSASEDGTLRQHDLRESVRCPSHTTSEQECRNVLLDLRSGSKKSLQEPGRNCLELKTCAISPTRPHHLLIGGSDAFARLYDRRMLPPLTSALQPAKPPPPVCYFCPAHLSEHGRSGIHLTHVMFSSNGEEVLLSYSGEHVYLMDAFRGQSDHIVYRASDVSKRTVLAPVVNGVRATQPSFPPGALGHGYRRSSSWVEECERLVESAKKAPNYLDAIEACSEVIDAGGPAVGALLRHDCLCHRAATFLKRLWKNDAHMAIRDCNEARRINPASTMAHHHMAGALSVLQKHKEALEFAVRAHHLEPTDTMLLDHVTQLRVKLKSAEDARDNRSAASERERDSKLERKSRIRQFRHLILRSDSDNNELLPPYWRSDSDDQDLFDDDIEMEVEIEMSCAGDDDERYSEEGPPGSSLSLRLRPRLEVRDRISRSLDSPAPANSVTGTSDETSPQSDIAVDMRQRYVGHCNTGTDIKQASFLGERGDFVASGSDDGRWFIWAKKSGRLVKMLAGDEHVVNCVQCHPFDCAIATSGIDYTIKLWTPCAEGASMVAGGSQGPETGDCWRVMGENQSHMRRQGLPLEDFLHRFRVQETNEGAAHPFECTPS